MAASSRGRWPLTVRWHRPFVALLVLVLLWGVYNAAPLSARAFCGVAAQPGRQQTLTPMKGARSVIEGMYSAVNARDLERAMSFIDEDVVYEDFTFQEPFKGREGVRQLFGDAMSLPKGLDFVIDEVAGGDSWSGDDSVGMTWHVEFDGVPLPNGRGASLYRTKGGKLVYARDIVESPLKLGGVALGLVGFIAPIIRARNQAGGGGTSTLGLAAAFATAAALYWYVLLLSPQGQFPFLAGPPAWAIDETTLRNVVDESLNFFYIWPGLDAAGLPSPTSLFGLPLPQVDPLRLALFNFSEAYALLFLPLLIWDRPSRKDVSNWWAPAMFLTNAILLPYFTTRALGGDEQPGAKPGWAPAFGITALLVAAVALWQAWGLFCGLGDLLLGDRVAFAFAVDCTLFALLQAYVFSSRPGPAWRFVPFLGLAAWQVLPGQSLEAEEAAMSTA